MLRRVDGAKSPEGRGIQQAESLLGYCAVASGADGGGLTQISRGQSTGPVGGWADSHAWADADDPDGGVVVGYWGGCVGVGSLIDCVAARFAGDKLKIVLRCVAHGVGPGEG